MLAFLQSHREPCICSNSAYLRRPILKKPIFFFSPFRDVLLKYCLCALLGLSFISIPPPPPPRALCRHLANARTMGNEERGGLYVGMGANPITDSICVWHKCDYSHSRNWKKGGNSTWVKQLASPLASSSWWKIGKRLEEEVVLTTTLDLWMQTLQNQNLHP